MREYKNFTTPSNIIIIVLNLVIVISTAALLYVSPKNFEMIFGVGTVLFVSLGIYVNLQSLATAQSAQADSRSSANSAKGSFLTLKKQQFLVPLFAPYSDKARFHQTKSLDASHNPSAIFLVNNAMGTAANISYSFHFLNTINRDDYHDLKFESDDVSGDSPINKSFFLSNHRGFPKF